MSHSPLHRILLASGLAVAVFGLSACQQDSPFGDEVTPPSTLVVSAAYVQGNDAAQARLESLQRAIDGLRTATGSGWTGRQDDLTGYLAELSGGRFASGADGAGADSLVRALMDGYGLDLFGVGYTDLRVGDRTAPDITGSASVRADQELDGVPVLDGQLVFTIGDPGGASAITAVRGRVFSGLSTTTDPALPGRSAARTAERLSGGTSSGRPTLVVVPTGTGRLAWEVAITGTAGGGLGLSDGRYYLDAATGDLVELRPANAHAHPVVQLSPAKVGHTGLAGLRALAAAAPGNAVQVSGTGPIGEQLTAVGIDTGDGIALEDRTTPTFDGTTGQGGIATFTADDTESTPGRLYVERRQNGDRISDPDALAAQAWSRIVYDYYAGLGRASWDGKGATLLSTVNFGDDTYCNAFFSDGLNPPQMVYGNPCRGEGGLVQLVTLDVAGHEITHGVTGSTAGLVYSGQQGALNESFSDYFGNVIGNRARHSESSTLGEDACAQVTAVQNLCDVPTPDGGYATREMLNGNTYADYLRLLNPTLRMRVSTGYDADHGGVHLNSAIWNNALWSIRTRLAQIDGAGGNDSKLAGDFDKIVYAALTTQLGPASGFVDARAAIEKTAVDAGADATIVRVVRETFDQNQICAGCVDVGTVNGAIVSDAPQSQIEPSVHGDEVTWIDLSLGNPGIGFPALAKVGGQAASLAAAPETVQLVFAGDAKVAIELPSTSNEIPVVRYDDAGNRTVLAEGRDSTVLAGIAGSDEGAAWVTAEEGTVSFVDPAGAVTTEDLPGLGGDTVTALGTGGGVVALGTEQGRVLRWEPGAGFTQLGSTRGTVFSVATYGDRVLAVDDTKTATLFDGSGGSTELSRSAGRFGAAVNGDYAVWSEAVGTLGGGIAEELGGVADTDLYLYSFETGTIYNLLAQTGQQGYPAISGDRIVWQDTVFGGNDILTAELPSGL